MTKIDDHLGSRNECPLKLGTNTVSKLWITPDGSMHVYYTTTHWKHV